jgi:hypothetical protein
MSYRLPLITVNGFKDGYVGYSWFDWPLIDMKKSLKKPNGQLEAVQTIQWPKVKQQSTNNDLQNSTQKAKDRATRTLLKTGGGGGNHVVWKGK